MFKESWATALFIVAVALVGVVLLVILIKIWARRSYRKIQEATETPLDVDAFVNVEKNPINYVYCALVHRLTVGFRTENTEPLPLSFQESPHVPGLLLSSKSLSKETTAPLPVNTSHVVIGTIRMGFGHHRIAYAVASWAMEQFDSVYFHDFLNIDSDEANLLTDTDNLYSKGSRLASELGGPFEKLWGKLMLSGDANALRVAAMTAVHLRPLLLAMPKDTPFVATHQLVALTAVAAGFTNVINLVIDNHPQWFLVVPQCLNLVQGPVNYQSFLKMGIPPSMVRFSGHWCPQQLVDNVPYDCQRRIDRARAGFTDDNKPICARRILIPVGGAGAQRKFILCLVERLAPMVRTRQVQLFLNAGDHLHMKTSFHEVLKRLNLQHNEVDSMEQVRALQERLLDGNEQPDDDVKGVTLFCFDNYFPAVATTDIMCRVVDVLACKPSEMAFYPIPKLMIRRVGNHEADSALRTSELGDGTCEAREIDDCMDYVKLFTSSPDLLVQMNESVLKNAREGVYDGCKEALRHFGSRNTSLSRQD